MNDSQPYDDRHNVPVSMPIGNGPRDDRPKKSEHLTIKESRAVQRLIENICADGSCGDTKCTDIRRTVGALKRLVARLDRVHEALDS